MLIKLIDTFDQIKEYKDSNPQFDIKMWKKYANSISESLFDKCYSNADQYDFNHQVVPVINDALYNKFDCIESAHIILKKNIDLIQKKASAIFNMENTVDVLFYLGLCNGAGWASKLDGRDTVL